MNVEVNKCYSPWVGVSAPYLICGFHYFSEFLRTGDLSLCLCVKCNKPDILCYEGHTQLYDCPLVCEFCWRNPIRLEYIASIKHELNQYILKKQLKQIQLDRLRAYITLRHTSNDLKSVIKTKF